MKEKIGGPQFFWVENGGLERSKGGLGGGGSSLIKVRDFHLLYFGIMFEGGS